MIQCEATKPLWCNYDKPHGKLLKSLNPTNFPKNLFHLFLFTVRSVSRGRFDVTFHREEYNQEEEKVNRDVESQACDCKRDRLWVRFPLALSRRNLVLGHSVPINTLLLPTFGEFCVFNSGTQRRVLYHLRLTFSLINLISIVFYNKKCENFQYSNNK